MPELLAGHRYLCAAYGKEIIFSGENIQELLILVLPANAVVSFARPFINTPGFVITILHSVSILMCLDTAGLLIST
jgi:hypothetical protein